MKTKSRAGWLLAILLLWGMFLLCPAVRAAESGSKADADPDFAGERSVVYEIDSGLLPNYVAGGRTALEGYLRVYKPDWLTVDFTTEDRKILMQMSFPFSDMQDYRDKLAALSLRTPVLLYEDGGQITYCDNLAAADLLNFLRTPMKEKDALGSLSFSVLFRFREGSFVLNGQTYAATSPLCVNCTPADMTVSDLQIRTVAQGDGSYERTVTVSVPQEIMTDTVSAFWQGQMRVLSDEVISNTQGNVHQFGVTFTATGADQLALKTTQALNVPDTAAETLSALDQENVGVVLRESLELQTLLDQEEGQFSYQFSLGSGCDTLMVPKNGPLTLEEDQAQTSDLSQTSDLAVGYHRPFGFTSTTVITDLTDPHGKLSRTIRYTVPLTVADYYHQDIKQMLSNTLVRGQVLEIYDTTEERLYEISYQSWFPGQLTEMTKAQFPQAEMSLERTRIPYLTSRWVQTWGNPVGKYAVAADAVSWQLLLPEGTEVTDGRTEGQAAADLVWRDHSRYAFLTGGVLLGACLLLLLILLILILLLRHRWKKFRAAGNRTVRGREPVTVQARTGYQTPPDNGGEVTGFCEMCGAPLKPGEKFCGRCGHKRV